MLFLKRKLQLEKKRKEEARTGKSLIHTPDVFQCQIKAGVNVWALALTYRFSPFVSHNLNLCSYLNLIFDCI